MSGYGLEILVEGPGATVDLVFVHGLGGDRERTWTASNGTLWSRDLLPKDIPEARVLAFGYDAAVARFVNQAVSQNRMETNAADLAASLVNLRSITNSAKRPIIFVAHSLGGLVCAQVLVMGDRREGSDNLHLIAQHTCGMAFFGTPFRGSDAAPWASTVLKMAKALWDTNSRNLVDLQRGSDTLSTLRDAFPGVLRKRDLSRKPTDRVNTVFFVEQLKTKGVLIVDSESAAIPGRGDKISLHADHIGMCKFDSRENYSYQTVAAALKKLLPKNGQADSDPVCRVVFNNYDQVKNQVAGDQNITGSVIFN